MSSAGDEDRRELSETAAAGATRNRASFFSDPQIVGDALISASPVIYSRFETETAVCGDSQPPFRLLPPAAVPTPTPTLASDLVEIAFPRR